MYCTRWYRILICCGLFLNKGQTEKSDCWNKSGRCQKTSFNCTGGYEGRICNTNPIIQCCLPVYCDDLSVVSRQEWGARPPTSSTYLKGGMPFVFIHHTTMDFCSDITFCSNNMQKVQNFHMDERGWDDIGYSFLVGEDGRIYVGRGWNRVGAHTFGYNDKSIGISVMGDFRIRKPKQAAITAVKALIQCGVTMGKINPDYKLFGHRQVRDTSCPGDYLYDIIRTWPHHMNLVHLN